MVGCGHCDDWFHGDCVGLDLAKVKQMEGGDQEYVCLQCCTKDKYTTTKVCSSISTALGIGLDLNGEGSVFL